MKAGRILATLLRIPLLLTLPLPGSSIAAHALPARPAKPVRTVATPADDATDARLRPAAETDVSVLFDEAHDEWTSIEGNYQALADDLRAQGYTVASHDTGELTSGTLSSVDVLVIGTAWGGFTSGELDVIEQFVKDGGGLFITGVGWSWVASDPARTIDNYPMNHIATRFGFKFLDGYVCDPTDYHGDSVYQPIFSAMADHPITDDLSSVGGPIVPSPLEHVSNAPEAVIFGDDDAYSSGGSYATGTHPPVLSAAKHGAGCVAALGHEGYLTTEDFDDDGVVNRDDHDNAQLGRNIIAWLNGCEASTAYVYLPLVLKNWSSASMSTPPTPTATATISPTPTTTAPMTATETTDKTGIASFLIGGTELDVRPFDPEYADMPLPGIEISVSQHASSSLVYLEDTKTRFPPYFMPDAQLLDVPPGMDDLYVPLTARPPSVSATGHRAYSPSTATDDFVLKDPDVVEFPLADYRFLESMPGTEFGSFVGDLGTVTSIQFFHRDAVSSVENAVVDVYSTGIDQMLAAYVRPASVTQLNLDRTQNPQSILLFVSTVGVVVTGIMASEAGLIAIEQFIHQVGHKAIEWYHDHQVEYFSVVGLPQEEAVSKLKDHGFWVVKYPTDCDEAIPEGHVCRQRPNYGDEYLITDRKTLPEGYTVTLLISTRKDVDFKVSKVYTADEHGDEKTAFTQCETIVLGVVGASYTDDTIDVTYDWVTEDPNGDQVDRLSYSDWSAQVAPFSCDHWGLERPLSLDLVPGTYTFRGVGQCGNVHDEKHVQFSVSAKDADLSLSRAVTCGSISDGEPVDVRDTFSTAEEGFYVYTLWDHVSSKHDLIVWFVRPDGRRHHGRTHDFSGPACSYPFYFWVPLQGHFTDPIENFPGRWTLEIWLDDQLLDTRGFTVQD